MLTFLPAFARLARLFRHLLQQPESRALLFMAAAVIGVGTLFYHNVEGWRWLDELVVAGPPRVGAKRRRRTRMIWLVWRQNLRGF